VFSENVSSLAPYGCLSELLGWDGRVTFRNLNDYQYLSCLVLRQNVRTECSRSHHCVSQLFHHMEECQKFTEGSIHSESSPASRNDIGTIRKSQVLSRITFER
jgi:hypothetical protein